MKPSILQLEGYYIRELRFSINQVAETSIDVYSHPGLHYSPKEVDKVDPLTINVASGGASKSDDSYAWRLQINVESNNPPESNYPYVFYISLVGFFRMSTSIPKDNVEAITRMLGTAFLYSAAREALATATGRGPYPAVVLPVVTFQDSPLVKPDQPKDKDIAVTPKKPRSKQPRKQATHK